MSAKKKLEEKHLKSLKALQQMEFNKRCFECDQRGPAYIDVTVGSFVCTSCGGILRGLNPPHRVKSVSMATFTPNEISFMESRGNEYCKYVYLGKFDAKAKPRPDSKDPSKLKYFMEQKYEHKRWYVPPEQAQKPVETVKPPVAATTKAEAVKPLSSLLGNSTPQLQVNKPPNEVSHGNDILFSSPTTNQVTNTSQPSSNIDGFADFGNAFTGQNFDNFGDFTSGTPSNAPTTTASGFANFSNFLTPMTSDQNQTQQPAPSKSIDKYADLGDIFSIPAPTSADPGVWSGPSASPSNSSSGTSVFGMSSTNQTQNSVFGSKQNSVFGNAVQQQPSVFGSQQNSSSPYGGVPQNNMVNSQNQASSTFGMQQQSSSMFGNATQSSSSPFSYTQQAQSATAGFNAPQNASGFNSPQNASGFNAAQSASGFNAAQSASGFNAAQSAAGFNTAQGVAGFNPSQSAAGFGYTQQSNTTQVGSSQFGFTQPSNTSTATSFGSVPFNSTSTFGGAGQAATFNVKPQQQQQGFMPGSTPAGVPNPFMQSNQSSTSAMQPQNPFMMQQSAQQPQQPFASQSNPTNPFMSNSNAAQPRAANPFF